MTSKCIAEAYTNEFDQVLNPGDRVVYVGGGYNHRVTVNVGTFAGVFKSNVYDREQRKYVEVVVALKIEGIPGRRWEYDYTTKNGGYKDIVRTATLPLKRAYKLDTPLSSFNGKNLGS